MVKAVAMMIKKKLRAMIQVICRALKLSSITRGKINLLTCSKSSRDAWSN
jgi:hypothetical protein